MNNLAIALLAIGLVIIIAILNVIKESNKLIASRLTDIIIQLQGAATVTGAVEYLRHIEEKLDDIIEKNENIILNTKELEDIKAILRDNNQM